MARFFWINLMMNQTIKPYPLLSVAHIPINKQLAAALMTSVAEYLPQLQGRRIWLCCSGGRDSLALAAICLQLYQQNQLPFLPQLLHVNHGLQAHSEKWALHIANWAQAQQLPCHVLSVKVQGSDEQAARQARYQAMLGFINKGDVLLLGHHADDQAETVLMRLIQGAGIKGLSAMQPWRIQSDGARSNVLWRPWLTVRRDAISRYAEQIKLPYIDDPTNDNGDNLRSSLRREIMPQLTTYNPNAIENIARSAELLRDAHAIVNAQAQQDCHYVAINQRCYLPVQRVLDIDKLQTLPIYRQRQLLHYWLAQDEPLPPTKQLIDEVMELIQRQDNNHQTQLEWYAQNQCYSIRRYRQQLYRLSYDWLHGLSSPLIEQTKALSRQQYDSQNQSLSLTVREANSYVWQLQISSQWIKQLLSKSPYDITLQIAPLSRQQYIQTSLSGRPQSGKKLYQTLGIPVWLRDSLVVVSAVWTDGAAPLLLLSPFDKWVVADSQWLTDDINNGADNTLYIAS